MTRRFSGFGPGRMRGFSMIEMVAAFLIFALAVGLLMELLTTSLHATRRSAEYTQAALWAESRLDTVGVGERIEAGQTSGEFDGDYRWNMVVEQIDPSSVEPPPVAAGIPGQTTANTKGTRSPQGASLGNGGPGLVSPVELYQVDLTVLWGNRDHPRQSHFVTLRATNPDTTGGLGSPRARALPNGAALPPGRQP